MAGLHDRLREQLRERLVRAGSTEYADRDAFEAVAKTLERAIAARDRGELLVPELLPDEEEWRVDAPLRLSTHRPLVGAALLFIKRRILLPLNRWLYEYIREHFRRQHQVNLTLFACLESLALENARLRKDLEAGRGARTTTEPPPNHR